MKVTKQYLLDNRTSKGGFSKAQINALGIEWPPQSGWMDFLEGSVLSEKQRIEFEISKRVTKKSSGDAINNKLIELINKIDSLENRLNSIENLDLVSRIVKDQI